MHGILNKIYFLKRYIMKTTKRYIKKQSFMQNG